MSIRPLQDRIIIKRIEAAGMSKGGIIIPDQAKEKPLEAKVLAVGSGAISPDGSVRKLDVKKGDTVLIQKYSGTEIKLDDEDCLIIREEDVLAVVESPKHK